VLLVQRSSFSSCSWSGAPRAPGTNADGFSSWSGADLLVLLVWRLGFERGWWSDDGFEQRRARVREESDVEAERRRLRAAVG
jgi:hypothetical protein